MASKKAQEEIKVLLEAEKYVEAGLRAWDLCDMDTIPDEYKKKVGSMLQIYANTEADYSLFIKKTKAAARLHSIIVQNAEGLSDGEKEKILEGFDQILLTF